jgi:alpha-tubulin suppressor-like RCC1 family protein
VCQRGVVPGTNAALGQRYDLRAIAAMGASMKRTLARAALLLLLAAPATAQTIFISGFENGEAGSTCILDSACATGFCSDGVCCDARCDGQCESCGGVAHGTCGPVTGTPVGGRTACNGSGLCGGTCDGVNGDSCTYPTLECRAASCADGVATAAASCASGACPAVQNQVCEETVDTKRCGATACAGVVDVVGHNAHTFVRMSDDSVWAWGLNYKQVLGVDEPNGDVIRKPTRFPELTGVKKLVSSPFLWTMCGIFEGGVLRCWGDNRYGQLGRGTQDDLPHRIPMAPLLADGVTPLTGVADVSAGTYHTCAVKTDRSVVCWGRGIFGRLADNNTTDHYLLYPTTVQPAGILADHIHTGEDHNCIMTSGGTSSVSCWGPNSSGESGVSAGTTVPIVTLSAGGNGFDGTAAEPMALGNGVSCARHSGSVKCWGNNQGFQLGRGDAADGTFSDYAAKFVCGANTATCSDTDRLANVSSIALGEVHACAVANQAVRCWGDGNNGQMGDGSDGYRNYAGTGPVFPQPVTKVAAGQYHSCALLADRTIRCWGRNNLGELGIPATDYYFNTPQNPVW